MNDFKVTKQPTPVTLFLMDGIVLEGTIFLAEYAASHMGSQTELDLFLEEGAFLPLTDNGGTFHLVNRSHISHARLGASEPRKESAVTVQTYAVCLTFVGGDCLSGVIHSSYPAGQERLQDLLNHTDRFFELYTDTHTYLVSRRHIRQVESV